MKMNNMLKNKLIIVGISLNLALLGLMLFEELGFNLGVARDVIGFLYLTFLPGMLILKMLKIDHLGVAEYITYSVGCSLCFVMFNGVLVNMLLPLIGMSSPIREWPLIISFSLFTGLLLVLLLLKVKYDPPANVSRTINIKISSLSLLSVFLPVLAIFGGLINTYYINSNILILFLLLIPIIIICILYRKISPSSLLVYMMVVALMFYSTIVSQYPMLLNVDGEYFFAQLVKLGSIWDWTIPYNVNGMLSIVMLAPVYSALLNVNTGWLFKILYPILFAFGPLALYLAYSRYQGAKYALLGIFFFVSMFYFYTEAFLLRRQLIATMFLSLIILIISTDKLTKIQKSALLVLFSFGLYISHYAVGYIFLVTILLSCFAALLFSKIGIVKFSKFYLLRGQYVVLISVLCLSWYMFVSSSSPFTSIVLMGENIIESIGEFLKPTAKSAMIGAALGMGFWELPVVGKLFRVFQYITQILITLGVLGELFKQKVFAKEFTVIAFVNLMILTSTIILPFVSIYVNMPRIYFITLFVLSPFIIVGIQYAFDLLSHFKKSIINNKEKLVKISACMILMPYFFFNTGLVFECLGFGQEKIGDHLIPHSPSLSYGKVDTAYYKESEINGVKFLYKNKKNNEVVYTDRWFGTNLLSYWNSIKQEKNKLKYFPRNTSNVFGDSYIYLRTWNIKNREIILSDYVGARKRNQYFSMENERVKDIFKGRNLLYFNGGAKIYGNKW